MRTLWILTAVLAAAALALFVVFAFFLPPPEVSPLEPETFLMIRRVRADQATVAGSLEEYRNAYDRWPAVCFNGSPPKGFGVTASMIGHHLLDSSLPDRLVAVSTEVACHLEPDGFLLVSAGPDGDFDVDNPGELYARYRPARFAGLTGGPWTYDPTNGIESSGDIWRVRD